MDQATVNLNLVFTQEEYTKVSKAKEVQKCKSFKELLMSK